MILSKPSKAVKEGLLIERELAVTLFLLIRWRRYVTLRVDGHMERFLTRNNVQ